MSSGSAAADVAVVRVEVEQAYDVNVGSGLLHSLLPEVVSQRQVALISDETVMAAHGHGVVEALTAAGKSVLPLVVPPGEASKSLERYGALLEALAGASLPRDAAVVALGGGVVGDLAGFVAASYLRGVAFYQAPTSLLAMVDASVGGKTGLDLPQGKNLVGAFWQPRAVVADVNALRTLPAHEFRQGTVEAFKHGLLAAPDLLAALGPSWAPDAPSGRLAAVVARNVAIKAAVVAADEREAGVRTHLNLGHTLAHALETVSGHSLAHGDAVAYGLVYAAIVGRRRGYADLVGRTLEFLRWVAPRPLPRADFASLLAFMGRDKKVAAGRLRMVLLEDVGQPVVVADLTSDELAAAWAELEGIA